jgi:hypothetical protein
MQQQRSQKLIVQALALVQPVLVQVVTTIHGQHQDHGVHLSVRAMSHLSKPNIEKNAIYSRI